MIIIGYFKNHISCLQKACHRLVCHRVRLSMVLLHSLDLPGINFPQTHYLGLLSSSHYFFTLCLILHELLRELEGELLLYLDTLV